MKTRRMILTFIIILSQLVSVVSPVGAVPPLPSSFSGTVKVGGANVPDGTVVSALILGVQYASALSFTSGPDSVYFFNVPGDDASTPGVIEGGTENQTINFAIGDLVYSYPGMG